jgi:hypothetical protein
VACGNECYCSLSLRLCESSRSRFPGTIAGGLLPVALTQDTIKDANAHTKLGTVIGHESD